MTPFVNDSDFQLYVGDVRDCLRELAAESVHTVVTSPPYFGLRDYSSDGQIGLEATLDEFVAVMVDVFREVRRVMRSDATLWLNLGDAFTDKQLQGAPWRVAFALQADGWYLRSDIIWAKPNPMPESVTDRPTKSHEYVFLLSKSPRYFFDQEAVREALSPSTFERWGDDPYSRRDNGGEYTRTLHPHRGYGEHTMGANPAGRNVRSVWEIATQPYPEAHFATFPEALPERCIKAGTSERGCCPECGAPWIRVTETMIDESRPPARRNIIDPQVTQSGQGTNAQGSKTWGHYLTHETKGWLPGCPCAAVDGQNICSERDGFPPVPCTVLDPFMGSGTTALVARRLGRKSIGVELNPEYAALCARRLQQLSLEFA